MRLFLLIVFSFILDQGKDSIPSKKTSADVAAVNLPAPQYEAYIPGEKLEYGLKYTLITGAHAILEVKKDLVQLNSRDHYHIYIEAKTNKFFDDLYMVRDYYESFVDKKTLLPAVFNRDISENHFKKKESYIFDRINNTVKQENRLDTVPPGTFDIISAFYYMRSVDFDKQVPGTKYKFDTYFDKSLFPVGAEYVGKSVISTDLGKFKVRVFRPKLIKGRIFSNQTDMTLYVSDDSNQVPIRIESAVYLDKVRADLEKFSNLKYRLSSKIN